MRILKAMLERTIASSPLPALARRRVRFDALILAYHNIILDDSEPGADGSLHVRASPFADQLDALERTHRVVGLEELLLGPSRAADRPRVAITFDDAYRGALLVGVPALAARGMPATVFVSPGMLGGRAFWWDAFRFPSRADADSFRALALNVAAGADEDVRALAVQQRVHMAPTQPFAVSGTEGDVAAAVHSHPGLKVASHTWTHPNLTRIDDGRLADELSRPLEWLTDRFADRMSGALSYPYGLFDGRVASAARAAGYDAALAIDGGWLRDTVFDRFSVPRLNIPSGLSTAGFRLRIDGVLGV